MTEEASTHESAGSSIISLNDAKVWEQRSSLILTAIRCVVDGLRSSPSLNLQVQLQSSTDKKDGSSSVSSLLMHLESLGVMQQVQELQQPDSSPPQTSKSTMAEGMSLGSILQHEYYANERKQIMYEVIFPLLRHLEQCYGVLDTLPQSAKECAPTVQSQSTRNRRKKTAKPPMGMLSLNDYTNVACLLEFVVSISLLPCMEYPNSYLPQLPPPQNNKQNISPDVQIHKINHQTTIMAHKRNQSLPKSLAGRISKMALTWGTKYAAENHNTLCDKLSVFSKEHPQDSNTLQFYHVYNIFQSYNEFTTLASSIGNLLLLDRFRPMLLPRHLSDVYLSLLIAERLRWYLSRLDKYVSLEIEDDLLATLIERERMIEKNNSQRLHTLQRALMLSPLMFPSSLISPVAKPSIPLHSVDSREAALAYRNLLGGGASMIMASGQHPATPQWLRLRLGQCLTKLAQSDLQSVVEVFVAYASGPISDDKNNINTIDDAMTSAAARLSRALCAKPTNSTQNICYQFQERLCTQFVDFLVVQGEEFMKRLKENEGNELVQSRSTMAMHLSLWATVAQLPIESIHSFLRNKLMTGLGPIDSENNGNTNDLTPMQSVAAIASWLLTFPSSQDPSTKKKLQSLLLEPCESSEGRLTILNQILRLVSSFSQYTVVSNSALIVEVDKDEGDNTVTERLVEITLAQIIHVLVNTGSDQDHLTTIALELLQTLSANEYDKKGYSFEKSDSGWQYRRNKGDIDISHRIGQIETRTKCLIRVIVSLSKVTGDASDGNKRSDTPADLVLGNLFRVALLLHYSNLAGSDGGDHNALESQLKTHCNRDELKIPATVVLATLCETCSPSSLLGGGQHGVLEILGLIIKSTASHVEKNLTTESDKADSEELVSTVSIVISLLIALLELGEEKRSETDELFFKSILPSLRVLCSGEDRTSPPELAEMASHAMSLIVSRGSIANRSDVENSSTTVEKSRLEAIIEKLSQAERDMQSSQPPLRAKGVVSLRHIARSLVGDETSNSNREESSQQLDLVIGNEEREAVITEVHGSKDSHTNTMSDKEELALISRTLAMICLNALADTESYVYLASIQTLVAISDVCPSEIMPLMGAVIAKGEVNIKVASKDPTAVTSVKLSLSPEQRIKAIEALIFMIRRRGDGIFMNGPYLLDTMLYGSSMEDQDTNKDEFTSQLIQSQTHSYFVGEDGKETEWNGIDEKKIRINTGGPVFSMEETDVLRAGAVSVVCELVSVLEPITVASYCHILVGLVINALQLDSSRPVRRIAACLARELYDCTMKEVTAEHGVKGKCTSTMAVAIVSADEEQMYHTLTRCVSAVEPITGRIDPASQSRCEEAIELRLELEGLGVLQAASLIANSLEQDMKDPTVQAVRKALSNSTM